MTDAVTLALITSSASLVVAFLSGWFTRRNSRKTDDNSLAIQDLKGAVDRDLERLKAKLSHGQLINSTQWNAEFSSYQTVWKGMVAIRTLATKLVFRESELIGFGMPDGYLASADRTKIRKELVHKFVEAAQTLLLAIHDNAPFYPSPIREAANNTHGAVKALIDKHLTALTTQFAEGTDVTVDEQFITDSKALLQAIIEGVDLVESLIRERLAAVQVVNSVKVSP